MDTVSWPFFRLPLNEVDKRGTLVHLLNNKSCYIFFVVNLCEGLRNNKNNERKRVPTTGIAERLLTEHILHFENKWTNIFYASNELPITAYI